MKKTIILAAILAVATSLSAVNQYPDSVLQKSNEEPNIATGWNFEFGGSLGVSSFAFKQLGSNFQPAVSSNHVSFPAWNAGIGINYYFLPWMGIGTGAEFASYANRTVFDKPWTQTTYDKYGTDPWCLYTMTSTPYNLRESQNIYMVEIPLALKFRARPGKLGFIGTAGVKLGIPIKNTYTMPTGGYFENKVYYEYFDLLMEDVPTVIEDITVPGSDGAIGIGPKASGPSLRMLNYAAHLELGMLIQVHKRVDLAISAFGTYYFNDVMSSHGMQQLGFYDGTKAGEYPMPYTASYNGVLRSNEVESLHPWAAGLKFTVHVNASKEKAKREYDKEMRRLRRAERDSLEKARREQEELEKLRRAEEDELRRQQQVEEEQQDTAVVTEGELDPRQRALDEIRRIAREYDIDVCQELCRIHDTVYIVQTVQVQTQTPQPAQQLDEHLQGAVIWFDLDKSVPKLEPADILDRIAAILVRHPQQKVYINGHACKLGKADYNKRLALRRAQAVADKLRALGVHDDQMIIKSLGANEPYRYNNGQHQLSKDRRVEIVPVFDNGVQATTSAQAAPAQTTSTQTTASNANVGGTTERVRQGSRLAQIARRHYGEPEFWIFIYEANKDKIADPSNLPVGMELIIPDLDQLLPGMTKAQRLEEARRRKSQL
ncbi:MAG: OmpA family protein [Paludibacteraceae bacterium]|nr:OmpA family protein [Paludibacteraceae bacterium]